ncbi:MAG: alkaline phosphatase family protein [Planctomycetota bacterium]|nr:alkaline phosphatase family protein [Planctomycetota bacterium]
MANLLRYLPLLVLVAALNVLLFADLLQSAVLPERAPAAAKDLDSIGRMIVIGIDGVDVRMLREYIAAGAMPNAKALMEQGALHPLRPELPPESPVSWSSLMTGVNPAMHGVFDFIRVVGNYVPENGMVDVRRARFALGRIPLRPPVLRSRLRAKTFVDRVHEAGYTVTSLRQPLLFPAPSRPGARLTSGLGTPDVAGSAGYYTLYSSRAGFQRGSTTFGGLRVLLEGGPRARAFETTLYGPFDPTLGLDERGGRRRAGIPLRFHVEGTGPDAVLRIELDGQTAKAGLGERTPFLPVAFDIGSLPPATVHGIVRFQVQQLEPLTVLTSPVNFDPRDAPFPISSPPSYGNVLWQRYGAYETVGWQEETFPLNDFNQTDKGFLDDLLADLERGAGILLGEMERGDRLVFAVFTATDRACHAFYRYRDEGHPLHGDRDEALGDPIRTVFTAFDDILGRVRETLGPNDTLLVASDHGFQTWRWQVHVNQWLVDNGYMTLAGDPDHKTLDHVFAGVRGPASVDWSKTRAFAMGLGQIYLNVKGRFPHGIVAPADADALADEIRAKLLPLENPYLGPAGDAGIGRQVFKSITKLRDVYTGRFLPEAPDLQLGFAEGYRVSWQTALLGGMRQGGDVFEPNRVPWSGDHCSTDQSLVPGIVLSNRPMPPAPADRPYHVRDIAATVLAHFGIDAPELEGQSEPIPLAPGP